jgi:cation diffusion facilitator CzcD-associated flavoprotein CzcO
MVRGAEETAAGRVGGIGPAAGRKGVTMRVFVAGAAGAIGRQLLPQLVARGHQVTAATRSPGRLARLRGLGAEPVVVDGLDALAVGEAVARAEPEAVIHQMTSLAGTMSLRHFDQTFAVTNRLRTGAPATCSPRPRPRASGASWLSPTPAGRTSAAAPR